jgi:hypothetical protein
MINVKDAPYNATGDGSTDDTAAINAAAQDANAGPEELFFPAGTYIYNGGNTLIASGVTWRGEGHGASVLKRKSTGNSRIINWQTAGTLSNFTITDLGFDLNGDHNEFASFIGIGNATTATSENVTIKNCRFFDSAPPTATEVVGTGDGSTVTFTKSSLMVVAITTSANNGSGKVRFTTAAAHNLVVGNSVKISSHSVSGYNTTTSVTAIDAVNKTFDTNLTFTSAGTGGTMYPKDRQPLSRTFTVTNGPLTATDDGYGSWTGDVNTSQPNSITYHRESDLTVTFSSPPANGTEITVTYAYCVQRQYILVLNAYRTTVTDNFLSEGGRIKVGSPGDDTTITGNHLRDVNDNGITVVIVTNQKSKRVIISDNVVTNPSTAGIYFGQDGDAATTGATIDQLVITGNVVTGSFTNGGIHATIPATSLGAIVANNSVRLLGLPEPGVAGIKIGSTASPESSGGRLLLQGNVVVGDYDPAGVLLAGTTHDVVVANNLLSLAGTERGIYLIQCTNVLITANNISGAGLGISFESGGTSAFDGIRISNNHIEYSGTGTAAGISVASGVTIAKSRIAGNYIEGAAHGIRLNSGNALELDVIDNDLRNNTTAGLTVASGSWSANADVHGNKGYDDRSLSPGIVFKTSNYTATRNDYTIVVDSSAAARTINLPPAADYAGRTYVIVRYLGTGNTVTIDANGSELIDNATTATVTGKVTVQSDGTKWFTVAGS